MEYVEPVVGIANCLGTPAYFHSLLLFYEEKDKSGGGKEGGGRIVQKRGEKE
ncbi:hypothetical protein V6Z12_D05G397300 [Gossypium hirsutum]